MEDDRVPGFILEREPEEYTIEQLRVLKLTGKSDDHLIRARDDVLPGEGGGGDLDPCFRITPKLVPSV